MVENLQVILIVKSDTWVFIVNRKYVNAQDRFQLHQGCACIHHHESTRRGYTLPKNITKLQKKQIFQEISWLNFKKQVQYLAPRVLHGHTLGKRLLSMVETCCRNYKSWSFLKKIWKFAQQLVWTPCGLGVQRSTNSRCILMLPYPFILFAEWAVCSFCIGNAKHVMRWRDTYLNRFRSLETRRKNHTPGCDEWYCLYCVCYWLCVRKVRFHIDRPIPPWQYIFVRG
jgi:hypothetical protein